MAVKPEAIREARINAGLTLAQLADGHVTKAAIHLIEHGRIRPSMTTLAVIAHKTGKPLSYFMQDQSEVGERVDPTVLQLLAYQGQFQELVEEAERLFPSATSAADVAWLRYYLGMGYVCLDKPVRGLEEVRAARAEFEHRGDDWMVVDCMEWEAAALQALEDPCAEEVAERALERCRGLDPVPHITEVRLLGRLGSISAGRSDWSGALRWYQEASSAADVLGDLSRLARMYRDMSAVYRKQGDARRAEVYSQKAVTIQELLRDQLSVARAENDLGLVLMRKGQLEPAAEHIQRSLELCAALRLEQGRSQVLLSKAELNLARDDLPAAENDAREARRLAEQLGERATEGMALHFLGAIALRREDLEAAQRHLEEALAIFEQFELRSREVDCRQAYAVVLEARGQSKAAIDQLERALVLATGR